MATYALTVSVSETSTGAFFSVSTTSKWQISQGGVSMYPNNGGGVLVNVYPKTLQFQGPAGQFYAGVSLDTTDSSVAGYIQVSPPVNVPTVITLVGDAGQQLGQTTIDAGTASGTFDFPVSGNGFASTEIALSTISGLLHQNRK